MYKRTKYFELEEIKLGNVYKKGLSQTSRLVHTIYTQKENN